MDNSELKVSQAIGELAKRLDGELEAIAGERMGFCLVAFSARKGGSSSYVSNCDRADVGNALKELLRYWEAGNEDIPAHEVH